LPHTDSSLYERLPSDEKMAAWRQIPISRLKTWGFPLVNYRPMLIEKVNSIPADGRDQRISSERT
jgi:hypothetical protein